MFTWTVSHKLPDGTEDVYTLCPCDLFGDPVLPGDKMLDENGIDIFIVYGVGLVPSPIYDICTYGHTNNPEDIEDPKYQAVCFASDGTMRFTDETIHYENRRDLVSWCKKHPNDF